jgi:hypothetical protein
MYLSITCFLIFIAIIIMSDKSAYEIVNGIVKGGALLISYYW